MEHPPFMPHCAVNKSSNRSKHDSFCVTPLSLENNCSGGPERVSPGGGAGRKLLQMFHVCDNFKTNLGQPTGLGYELDKDI